MKGELALRLRMENWNSLAHTRENTHPRSRTRRDSGRDEGGCVTRRKRWGGHESSAQWRSRDPCVGVTLGSRGRLSQGPLGPRTP